MKRPRTRTAGSRVNQTSRPAGSSLERVPATSAVRDWIGTEARVLRHVRVCGRGHLATATRIELERQGIHRETDYLLPSLRPPLVIACADSEADGSYADTAQQALDEGSPLLLCSLAGRVVRIGPLIDPYSCCTGLSHPPPDSGQQPPQPAHGPVKADPPLNLYARLGAILVSAQALNFLLGARNQCVRDRVVEINPWSMESKSYRVFPD